MVSSSESDSVTIYDNNGCSSTSLPVSIIVNYGSYSYPYTTACNSYNSPSGNQIWTTSGIYHDTIPTSSGCDSIIEITLTINSSYYATSYDSTSNIFILTLDAATLSNAVGYHWDFGDGTSSNLQNPSHTYAIDTTYNVCMKIYTIASDSCEYCDSIGKDYLGNIIRNGGFTINVQNLTTGISKNSIDDSKIEIYPNPTNGKFNLKMSGFENLKMKNLEVYNVIGERVYTSEIKLSNSEIDLHDQPNGIYFINIKTENGIVSKKIIINK